MFIVYIHLIKYPKSVYNILCTIYYYINNVFNRYFDTDVFKTNLISSDNICICVLSDRSISRRLESSSVFRLAHAYLLCIFKYRRLRSSLNIIVFRVHYIGTSTYVKHLRYCSNIIAMIRCDAFIVYRLNILC